jgi:RHS repeat-associated protein
MKARSIARVALEALWGISLALYVASKIHFFTRYDPLDVGTYLRERNRLPNVAHRKTISATAISLRARHELAERFGFQGSGFRVNFMTSACETAELLPSGVRLRNRAYYYRARYYDQNAGRFLSEDPKRFDGGINFYAYVSNSSPNKVDPFGLTPCWNKLTVTGVSNCSVQFVSAKGFSCKLGDPKGQVESLCDQLQKAIQKDGSADLPGTPCPSGQCCKNMQPQKQVQLVNEEFTVTKKGCTATFKLTGTFTVQGDVGTCSK